MKITKSELREIIREEIQRLDEQMLNEADPATTMVMMGLLGTVTVGGLGAIGAGVLQKALGIDGPFIKSMKDWFKDAPRRKEISKIITRLKADPEVMEFIHSGGPYKSKDGWKKLLTKKLSSTEMAHLKNIYHNDFLPTHYGVD